MGEKISTHLIRCTITVYQNDTLKVCKNKKKNKYLKVESLNGQIRREANFFFKACIS